LRHGRAHHCSAQRDYLPLSERQIIVSRGVLLDIPRLRGVPWLEGV
jgi:hypothetical protein